MALSVLAAVMVPPDERFSWMVEALKTIVPPPKMKSVEPSMYGDHVGAGAVVDQERVLVAEEPHVAQHSPGRR
ncbi:hypothetical protein V2I01_31615 [Micromonospora sp. BRA006-A]|nr:hypothetical protein [Micromonospora sp. BRA006-A]